MFYSLFAQGTVSFSIGFFFVISGWPVIGMAIEAYGFLILLRFVKCVTHETFTYTILTYICLFLFFFRSGFWPTLSVFVSKIPLIGWLFEQPFTRSVR